MSEKHTHSHEHHSHDHPRSQDEHGHTHGPVDPSIVRSKEGVKAVGISFLVLLVGLFCNLVGSHGKQ